MSRRTSKHNPPKRGALFIKIFLQKLNLNTTITKIGQKDRQLLNKKVYFYQLHYKAEYKAEKPPCYRHDA